jgi:RNA polymerase sigma-70 factor, ECF subfamily
MNLAASLSETALAEHRPLLFRFALLQVGDAAQADDLAQEALLAAWQAVAGFREHAQLRTWLIGILKHKIADHWRRSGRESLTDVAGDPESEGDDADYFLGDGHWRSDLRTWSNPEAALHQQEFWAIYEICQNHLPPQMARVFMLRELVGLEAAEICAETGLSDANYWVTMHRARLRLRECLEIRWFNRPEP